MGDENGYQSSISPEDRSEGRSEFAIQYGNPLRQLEHHRLDHWRPYRAGADCGLLPVGRQRNTAAVPDGYNHGTTGDATSAAGNANPEPARAVANSRQHRNPQRLLQRAARRAK